MQNSRKKVVDWMLLLISSVIFLGLLGGSIREYRIYRAGVVSIATITTEIEDLQSRKERLQKIVEENTKSGSLERQLEEKLGLIDGNEVFIAVPTTEPKLIDLRMEDRPRKTYWGEWWELLK